MTVGKRKRHPDWWSNPRDGLDFLTVACWTDAYRGLHSPYGENSDAAIRALVAAKMSDIFGHRIHSYADPSRDFPISVGLEFDEYDRREYVVRVGSFSKQLRTLIFDIGGGAFPIPNNRSHARSKREWVRRCLESFVVRRAIRETTEQ